MLNKRQVPSDDPNGFNPESFWPCFEFSLSFPLSCFSFEAQSCTIPVPMLSERTGLILLISPEVVHVGQVVPGSGRQGARRGQEEEGLEG